MDAHAWLSLGSAVITSGLFILAVIDVKTHEVYGQLTLLLAWVALLFIGAAEGAAGWTGMLLLQGVVTAAFAFAIYMLAGMMGDLGGGDIKLSPVPAALYGAASPFLGFFWICGSFILSAVILAVIAALSRGRVGGLPMVPAMFAASGLSRPLMAAMPV